MKTAITGAIEEVRYNGGHSTRKPSTVTMTVSHKFAIEVADLMEDYIKAGIEPEQGLLRLELIAVYADEPDELKEWDVPDDEIEAMKGTRLVDPEPGKKIVDTPPGETEPEQIIDDLTETVDNVLDGVDMEDTDGK